MSYALLKYVPEDRTFLELPGRMKIGRVNHVAIVVQRSIFPECP